MNMEIIVDPDYRSCMECSRPDRPKQVMRGQGVGIEVRNADTQEVVGYLHLFCKEAWAERNNTSNLVLTVV